VPTYWPGAGRVLALHLVSLNEPICVGADTPALTSPSPAMEVICESQLVHEEQSKRLLKQPKKPFP